MSVYHKTSGYVMRPSPSIVCSDLLIKSAMTLVRPSQVPEYLKAGSFYECLDVSTDEEFEVPDNVIKTDLHINSKADLDHQFRSLRYWGVSDLPYEIFDYILDRDNQIGTVCADFATDFPILTIVLKIRPYLPDSKVKTVIQLRSVYLLKYLTDRGAPVPESACSSAAMDGHLPMLKYLHETLNIPIDVRTCQNAFASGSMPCLEYLRDKGVMSEVAGFSTRTVTDKKSPIGYKIAPVPDLQTLKFALAQGCLMTYTLVECAASTGNLEILQYAHENGCSVTDNAARKAAQNNHVNILQYYHDHFGVWHIEIAGVAAQSGHLDCLRFVCDRGCPIDYTVAATAAYNGKLDCLQYLHSRGCPWGETVANSACEGGQVECLKYVVENGCPVYSGALKLAELHGSKECFVYLISIGITPPQRRR